MGGQRVWKFLASGIAIALLVLISACTPQSQTLSQTQESSEAAPPGAETVAPSSQLPRLAGPATVEMKINGKKITLAIDGQSAPVTAGNFVDLVNRGVYNGTKFHRVVRSPQPFVVQGGDPQSKDPNFPEQRLGTGGFIDPDTQKPRNIPLEILPESADTPVYSKTLSAASIKQSPHLRHVKGAVAMARSQLPDSASSQFYFTLADIPFLDGDYAVFGYVADGMDVIDQIQQGDVLESAAVTEGLDKLQ